MTRETDTTSIVLISRDPAIAAELGPMLRTLPKISLEERSGTLSEMNGTAVALAADHDIVIFRTDGPAANDLSAVAELREALPRGGMLVALADAAISLVEARSLTRAGVDEVLPWPINARDLRDQIIRWTSPPVPMLLPADSRVTPRQGKVIAVAQARGGVGSTTVAVNLADRLLDRHGLMKKSNRNKVALVDLDLQFGAVASFLDIESRDTFYHLAIEGMVPDANFLRQSLTTLPSGLEVLTAPARLAPMEALGAAQVAAVIDHLRAAHDYVIVDLPRTLVDWIAPVLARADRLLLVTDSTVPSIRQARRLIDFYLEENPALNVEVVVNHEKRPVIQRRHHVEAARILERPLTHWIADDPRAAREAVDRGTPLSTAAGRSSLARCINTIGRDLIRALQPTAPANNEFKTVRKA